ncbi:hypothetical protein JCM6882_000330 [Rhodosporidiobolus microsporus]
MASRTQQTTPTLTLRVLDATLPVLRLAQNGSAITFSLFAALHLASPLSALLPSKPAYLSSAENRASGVQLLAREVYQGEWSEPVLVWGSLGAHVLSGVAIRWAKVLQRLERRKVRKEEVKRRAREMASVKGGDLPGAAGQAGMVKFEGAVQDLVVEDVTDEEVEGELVATTTADEELVVPTTLPSSAGPLFPVPNFHQKTGYLLLLPLLHHAYLHRLLPSSPLPPISSLSPSFFSFSFPALALTHPHLPLRIASAAGYASVTLLAAYHGLVGWRVLLDPTAPRSLKPRRRRAGEKDGWSRTVTRGREWQAAWVALVAGVGVGTARIAGYLGAERSVRLPEFVARRMDFVLRKGMGMA